MLEPIHIDPEIHRAATLPSALYTDDAYFELIRERLFPASWQYLAAAPESEEAATVRPIRLLPGLLDEPLLLTRQGDELHCLSNVCTHRGNLVVQDEAALDHLHCKYHGRCFALDGRFQSMPEFDAVEGFPCASDSLPSVGLERWNSLLFTSLDPTTSFSEWFGPVAGEVGDVGTLRFDAASSRDYEVQANWALYCDNYLEGFHVPFVHAGLAKEVDYSSYRTELLPQGVLQRGFKGAETVALYYWLFPNLMLNFYPWGLSLNLVEPLGVSRTRVRFLSFVSHPELREQGAGGDLHSVELEDEAVVEAVQQGVRSRLYDRGRYSPSREQGVHHFHRLLAAQINDALAGG